VRGIYIIEIISAAAVTRGMREAALGCCAQQRICDSAGQALRAADRRFAHARDAIERAITLCYAVSLPA